MLDPTLAAHKLFHDPRIKAAKENILSALEDHRRKIISIRGPNPDLKRSYEELLQEFAQLRGGKLWYPYLGSGIGNGALVELADGSVKYDMATGIGVHFLGHSHPTLVTAGLDAAIEDCIMQGNLQQNVDSVRLSRLLVKESGLPHCFLTTSGAMAVENAIKIALQKNFPAQRILAFDRAFAGRTWINSQITDKPQYRERLPINAHIDYIPFYDAENPEESTEATLHALRKHLNRYPREYALMLMELVQGEGGFYFGSPEFFKAVINLLHEHHVAVIVDEVQSFGRLSRLFAFQHFGLDELVDIVTVGKMTQACATLFTDSYMPRTGLLSQTFTASSSAIKSSVAIIETLLKEGFYGPSGRNMQIHALFRDKLEVLTQRHPTLISGPYGIGCMVAFTPYGGDHERCIHLAKALFDAGVIVFIAGSSPTRIRMLVPGGCLQDKDVEAVMQIIETVLVKQAG